MISPCLKNDFQFVFYCLVACGLRDGLPLE
jgi:hypothetical protein